VQAIGNHSPDVVVLTEFRNNEAGEAIKDALRALGLQFAQATATPSKTNTVLIAANQEFVPTTFEQLGVDSHRCLRADFGNFDLFGVYFAQGQAKRPLFKFLRELPDRFVSSATLIAGDLNTGLHFEDEVGMTFHCADEFSALLSVGWVDVWRAEHGQLTEFTWHSRSGSGFRIDHVLASPAIVRLFRSVRYSHDERIAGLSDHSPMIAKIDLTR
jgi:exonuclease III